MVRTRVLSVKISHKPGSVEASISMFLVGQLNGHMWRRYAQNVYPQYGWFGDSNRFMVSKYTCSQMEIAYASETFNP
jgi:hypothetical protein